MVITLNGETPSKKNSRINTRSGRSFPNQRYVKWHDAVVSELNFLMMQKRIVPIQENQRIKLTVIFTHGDFTRRDSDNQLSSILDTLVDAGIIPDDNWKVVPEKHIYDNYKKNNAHCVIKIENYEG